MSLSKTIQHLAESHELILKGCLTGDRVSQQKLYNTYAHKMMGVCMWYAKNREEAEEILQDGFIRVFKYLKTFTGDGSFEGWMRKIMISAALTKYRNKSTQLRLVVEFDSEFHDIYEEPSFIYQYDEQELLKLIQTLSPAYRLVFNLYVFEGMKHREIAESLKISESTSKSNLADARKILQAALRSKNNPSNLTFSR